MSCAQSGSMHHSIQPAMSLTSSQTHKDKWQAHATTTNTGEHISAYSQQLGRQPHTIGCVFKHPTVLIRMFVHWVGVNRLPRQVRTSGDLYSNSLESLLSFLRPKVFLTQHPRWLHPLRTPRYFVGMSNTWQPLGALTCFLLSSTRTTVFRAGCA